MKVLSKYIVSFVKLLISYYADLNYLYEIIDL